jgi:hypothetical protein
MKINKFIMHNLALISVCLKGEYELCDRACYFIICVIVFFGSEIAGDLVKDRNKAKTPSAILRCIGLAYKSYA